jgi:hypothetical protein
MTDLPPLRSFQDVRDVLSNTIHQVRERDLTGDQAKSILGLLTLASETLVKEDAINRAVLANTSPTPGVRSETTTPAPAAFAPGSFILNLNVGDQNRPHHVPIFDLDPAPQAEIVEHVPDVSIAEHLDKARKDAHGKNNDLRARLLARKTHP